MVLRKPGKTTPSKETANPPYPTSPTSPAPPPPLFTTPLADSREEVYSPDLHTSPAFQLSTLDTARRLREKTESEAAESVHNTDSEWDTDGFDDLDDEELKPQAAGQPQHGDESGEIDQKKDILPSPLQVGVAQKLDGQARSDAPLPALLRVGPADGAIRKAPEMQPQLEAASVGSVASSASVPFQSHNPYLKYQNSGPQSTYESANVSAIWGENNNSGAPFTTGAAPVELPADRNSVDLFNKLSLTNNHTGQSSNSELPSPASRQPQLIPVAMEEAAEIRPRNDSEAFDPGMDVSSLDAFSSRNHRLQQDAVDVPVHRTWEQQQAWEKAQREQAAIDLARAQEAAKRVEDERRAEDEWHRGEAAATTAALQQPVVEEFPPPLPPRTSTEEQTPPKPARPQVDTARVGTAGPSDVETPGTRANRQRKEYYQIKHVRWFDHRINSLRQSPILIQNANGPCPLMALVNALVLSTPSNEETALVETLRTREQVTLGLLLDAVFDELMSGRRGGAAQELPDVSELYSFLITLHTGMNINPCFVNSLEGPADRNSGNFHPAVRGQARPGGFESTKEMKLYGTFNIPLVHGWLPPGESRAYVAFDRVAKTYEDAHVLQFQEEELEAKLQSQGGLNAEEQAIFEDLHTIKDFFNRWPTQLTTFGLEVLANYFNAGQIAIFFRNDHFSTLYKEPRSGQILTLVTDAGYARHEEIVWETLVDVNGQGSELYSGDFRPVGNMSENEASRRRQAPVERPIRSLLDDDIDNEQGWTTVESRSRPNHRPTVSTGSVSRPVDSAQIPDPLAAPTGDDAKKIEQEDHDLALALQLQEEEEDRHRRDMADRLRRENELNEQFISSEGQRPAANTAATNNSSSVNSNRNRPLIPPRRNHNGTTINSNANASTEEDAPPPTYEQAASGRPYHPPPGHPANAAASLGGRQPTGPQAQPQSVYGQMAGGPQAGPVHGRRRSGQTGMAASAGRGGRRHGVPVNEQEREKCIVM